jgi:hypothetical protein
MLCNEGDNMSRVTRVTVALPSDLWETVKLTIPSGRRSGMVAEAIQNELRHRKRLEQFEQLQKFQKTMRDKYGEFPASAHDIEQMRQERDEQ